MVNGLSADYLGFLSSAEVQKEGLPFWLFYLLLSIILLLLFTNFLQNKELRQKISYTLAGPRRKFNRLRLQVRLRKEEEKKAELFRELGKLILERFPNFPEIEDIATEIRSLEEESQKLQALWHEVYRKLENLKLEKRKLISAGNSGGTKPASLQEIEKEIETLAKNKAEIQDKLMTINDQLEPYHETIGRIIYKSRPEREELDFLYFQIGRVEENIKNLKKEIENL